jgi:hypothetical protein
VRAARCLTLRCARRETFWPRPNTLLTHVIKTILKTLNGRTPAQLWSLKVHSTFSETRELLSMALKVQQDNRWRVGQIIALKVFHWQARSYYVSRSHIQPIIDRLLRAHWAQLPHLQETCLCSKPSTSLWGRLSVAELNPYRDWRRGAALALKGGSLKRLR